MRIRLSKPYEQTGYKIQGLFRSMPGQSYGNKKLNVHFIYNKSMPVKPAPEIPPDSTNTVTVSPM